MSTLGRLSLPGSSLLCTLAPEYFISAQPNDNVKEELRKVFTYQPAQQVCQKPVLRGKDEEPQSVLMHSTIWTLVHSPVAVLLQAVINHG